jgi:hypothetical protein
MEKGDELSLNVTIPKKIFKTKSGALHVWGSKHYVPLSITVMEYILLGNLRANFAKRVVDKSYIPNLSR